MMCPIHVARHNRVSGLETDATRFWKKLGGHPDEVQDDAKSVGNDSSFDYFCELNCALYRVEGNTGTLVDTVEPHTFEALDPEGVFFFDCPPNEVYVWQGKYANQQDVDAALDRLSQVLSHRSAQGWCFAQHEVRRFRHFFGTISHAFSSSTLYHTRRAMYFTQWPCLSDPDWCLQSDGVPDSRLQVQGEESLPFSTKFISPDGELQEWIRIDARRTKTAIMQSIAPETVFNFAIFEPEAVPEPAPMSPVRAAKPPSKAAAKKIMAGSRNGSAPDRKSKSPTTALTQGSRGGVRPLSTPQTEEDDFGASLVDAVTAKWMSDAAVADNGNGNDNDNDNAAGRLDLTGLSVAQRDEVRKSAANGFTADDLDMLIMEKRQDHAMDSRRAEKWHMQMTHITLGAGVRIIDVDVQPGFVLGMRLIMPPTDLYGVRIHSVVPGADADQAGCKVGMVIVAVNSTVTLTSDGDWADLWDLEHVQNVLKSAIPGRIAIAVADADEYDCAVQDVLRAHWLNEPEARPSRDGDVQYNDLDIS